MAPRSRHALVAAGLAVLVAVASSGSQPSAAQTTPPTPTQSYLKDFDNYSVSEPTAFAPDATLDVLVHSRDSGTWASLEPMAADHGAMCEAPPAQHQLPGSYDDAVFICKDHLMTSIKAGGYGVIYLTPGALADFSQGETVIRWDVSTLRTSPRDWWDVWVTPLEDNLPAPFDIGEVDLAGTPKRGLTLRMDNFNGSVFRGFRFDNFVQTELADCWWCAIESALTPSASRRDTFELRLSKTHVKFWMPTYGTTWVDQDLSPALDWSQGVVQLGHHSYNPLKDCTPSGTMTCQPNTWHWDNLSISQAAPLTMIRANERAAIPQVGVPVTFTFPQPAPDDAYLRVEALGAGYQVSTDNGATWAPLRRQPSSVDQDGHAKPYWHPVPAGTTRVLLKTTSAGWWGQDIVDYASVWSVQAKPKPPAPTVIPPTPTPVPPTDTPTTGPTGTPIVLPTGTSTAGPATSTTVPAATATPFPATATAEPAALPVACQVQVILNGTPGPLKECQ